MVIENGRVEQRVLRRKSHVARFVNCWRNQPKRGTGGFIDGLIRFCREKKRFDGGDWRIESMHPFDEAGGMVVLAQSVTSIQSELMLMRADWEARKKQNSGFENRLFQGAITAVAPYVGHNWNMRDKSDTDLMALLEAARSITWGGAQNVNKAIYFAAKDLEIVIPRIFDNRAFARKREAERATKDTSGFVYLIKATTGQFKIGRSSNPEQRIKNLFPLGSPILVDTVCIITTNNMYQLERSLHDRFADKRVGGEWFVLDANDIDYIKGLAS